MFRAVDCEPQLHRVLYSAYVLLLCCPASEIAGQERGASESQVPLVSGFERFARHDEISKHEAGSLLISELNCTACHHCDDPLLQPKGGPRLSDAGTRLQQEWIRQFLSDPAAVDAGTTMPHLLATVESGEREAAVEALVAFLDSQRKPFGEIKATGRVPVLREFWNRGDPNRGRSLYHTVGCVACHAADESYQTEESKPSAIDSLIAELDPQELEELGLAAAARPVPSIPHGRLDEKYTLQSLTMLLYDPTRFRPDARMPSMRLLPSEAADIAAYLLRNSSDEVTTSPIAAHGSSLIERGRSLFASLGCASCHEVDSSLPRTLAKPLDDLDASAAASCLANSRGLMPHYDLDGRQIAAITQRLDSATGRKFAASDTVRFEMLKLNCFGCHQRDEMGGIGRNRKAYFHTEGHVDLGDEGRLPPLLTDVGRKLVPKSLAAVFRDGALSYRSYMTIRMPAYPVKSIETIVARLPAADKADAAAAKVVFEDAESAELVAAGRQLIDTGCVQCHIFRGEGLPGVVGVDLDDVTKRVYPRWFQQFVLQPGELKKRTRMPTFFPDGQSYRKDLLGGDVDLQIAAIWAYLHNLSEAGLPSQIDKVRAADYELSPSGRAIVLRTFMRQAGTHAIAVGFPDGVHFAFDAENVRPAMAWKGRFLDARGTWFERFAPPAEPLGDNLITLPSQPLLTRARKQRFGGYRLDPQGVPTFLYELQSSKIEDRLEPTGSGGLNRTIVLQSPAGGNVHLVAHAGQELQRARKMSVKDGNGLTVSVISGVETLGEIMPSDAGLLQWLLAIPSDRPHKIVLEYRW